MGQPFYARKVYGEAEADNSRPIKQAGKRLRVGVYPYHPWL